MQHSPFFLKLEHKPGLVVGGGEIAARKASRLIDGGMQLTVIAPEISEQMRVVAKSSLVTIVERAFVDSDIERMVVVVAATNQRDVNCHIAELCQARGLFVNVADDADEGDLLFPSLVKRDPIQIAISAGGTAPLLSRLLKAYLEGCIPTAYAKLAELVGDYRAQVKERYPTIEQRRNFWDTVLRGRIADAVFSGRYDAAREELSALLNSTTKADGFGEVYLVGAGPGDPDLLTIKALRLMQQADVVVYDRLVSDNIYQLLRDDIEKIYAGKGPSQHTMSQDQINKLLVDFARQGKKVLRLKGGDPFIFGRGGEEIATLLEQGIPFQVVPGITAALGCAAYSGIPLTHRDYAQSCVFVTGHRQGNTVNLDWQLLVRPSQTLVFYMGLLGLEEICKALIGHGMPSTTMVALVMRGTLPDQKVLVGNLSSIVDLVKAEDIKPPTLVIVGEVVKLYSKLQWYQTQRYFHAQK